MAQLQGCAENSTTVRRKRNGPGSAKEGALRGECVAGHIGRTTKVWAASGFGPNGRKMALFRCTQMILA